MMRKHKKIITLVAFILIACLVNNFLSFILIQEGLTRVAVNELTTRSDYECVVLGQSHSSYGISPEVMENTSGLTTMNFSIGGQYMMDMYYYVKEVYEKSNPEIIVLDVDFQYFINIPKKKNTIMSTLMYYSYPMSLNKIAYTYDKMYNKEYRALLFPWLNYRNNIHISKKIVANKLTKAYWEKSAESVTQIDVNDTYMGRGFLYKSRNLKRDENAKGSIWWNEPAVDNTTSIDYFKKIVEYCREKGSKVVMITTPITPSTLLNSVDEYSQIENYMQNLADENNLTYFDFNIVKPSVYQTNDNDYWDTDGHMYGDAAERYSVFLGEFVKKVHNGEDLQVSDYCYDNIYDMQADYKTE